ncbi:hypothetical protein CH76_06200 [Lysinibacillus sp. BF-4]|uniref:Uncharacterized protein n=1 Tax=Metalysinibacillus saudimassiliensis TaxID=1461583 RepID=A0A078MEM0_9BACL|nr:hypothetical protein [Lysinibacillus sp. BF-4]KFL43547.1 hypothetical protein CH76_06200 [Lysinibacillus sp. BF-4]CEA03146.1 hypothetical protein BN1050_01453 [Metalysinibacillus saudimassiliensis]
MLTFEQKQAIIESFAQLTKKEISLKRVNYHFEESLYEKKIVVEKLHPNGNGFVFVGDMPKYSEQAVKSMVNIRDYDEEALREIIAAAIAYLSEDTNVEEDWENVSGDKIKLLFEQRSWVVYYNGNFEEAFGTYEEAKAYLYEEGFKKQ